MITTTAEQLVAGDRINTTTGLRLIATVVERTDTVVTLEVLDPAAKGPSFTSRIVCALSQGVSRCLRPSDLKDGRRYRLTRGVANPRLDKRERYDASKLAWSADDVFRCWVGTAGAEPRRLELEAVSIQATPRNARGYVLDSHDGFKDLVQALKELTESALDICSRVHDVQPKDVLHKLLASGSVTTEQVEAACEAVNADYLKEE